MATEYTGAGSVRKTYGPISGAESRGVVTRESTRGDIKELSCIFDYSALPGYSAASVNDALKLSLPPNAAVTDFMVQVITTFVGGTSLEFGLVKAADGNAGDVDGLIPAAVGAVANLVAGYVISGRGACIIEAPDAAGTAHNDGDGVYAAGTTGPVMSVASLISVVAVGTFTAGRAKLICRYLEASPTS